MLLCRSLGFVGSTSESTTENYFRKEIVIDHMLPWRGPSKALYSETSAITNFILALPKIIPVTISSFVKIETYENLIMENFIELFLIKNMSSYYQNMINWDSDNINGNTQILFLSISL